MTHLPQRPDLLGGNWHSWLRVTGQVTNSKRISKPIPKLLVQGQGKLLGLISSRERGIYGPGGLGVSPQEQNDWGRVGAGSTQRRCSSSLDPEPTSRSRRRRTSVSGSNAAHLSVTWCLHNLLQTGKGKLAARNLLHRPPFKVSLAARGSPSHPVDTPWGSGQRRGEHGADLVPAAPRSPWREGWHSPVSTSRIWFLGLGLFREPVPLLAARGERARRRPHLAAVCPQGLRARRRRGARSPRVTCAHGRGGGGGAQPVVAGPAAACQG